jgi:hypothetical protein
VNACSSYWSARVFQKNKINQVSNNNNWREMMKRLLLILLSLSFLTGCGKKEEVAARAPSMAEAAVSDKIPKYLAYEHSLQIETEASKVTVLFAKALAVCHEPSNDACTVLESRVSSGDSATAHLKFRAKPGGIKKIVTALSQQAQVTRQSTTAEDLEGPIFDATKKLAMLKDYRAKLEALSGRASKDIDALIKVNSELAHVQSDIEALEGKHAHLMQRVETEILDVAIMSPHQSSFWRPIRQAISEFGGNLSLGISTAVTAIAYLIPWVLIFMLALWSGRKLWRRWKKS